MSIWRWADWIDACPADARITLGEGDTPVIPSRQIGPAEGLPRLFFKLENQSPAGSFKDRFAAAAISHMRANGQTNCIATSSGNTGSALAAYTAAAGIRCRIAIVEGAPQGKLRQMMAYGAEIFRVRQFGLDPEISLRTFETLKRLAAAPDAALQISSYIYSGPGMSGVETISLELAEQFPDGVEHVFCPAGGGGLCVAVARGYRTLVRRGTLNASPAIECVQPAGNNTIAGPMRDGKPQAQEVQSTTQISGLQVANVNDGHLVIEECRPTGGSGHLVSDESIWRTQQRLAQEEGIFTEPAGAVALAGALDAAAHGRIDRRAPLVCLVTGSGFKDLDSVDRMIGDSSSPLIDLEELEREAERL